MVFFKIRSRRISVEIPVKLFLKERKTGIVSQDYISGSLINLSRGGACVVVTKVMMDRDHVFFSTQDHKRFNLYIPDFMELEKEKFDLDAISVWMDDCDYNGRPSFKICMEFLSQQKELYSLLKKTYT